MKYGEFQQIFAFAVPDCGDEMCKHFRFSG